MPSAALSDKDESGAFQPHHFKKSVQDININSCQKRNDKTQFHLKRILQKILHNK